MSNYERSWSRPVPAEYASRTDSAYAGAFFPGYSSDRLRHSKIYDDRSYIPYVPNLDSHYTVEQEAELRKAHRKAYEEAYEEAYNRSKSQSTTNKHRGRRRSYSPLPTDRKYRYDPDENANIYTPLSLTSRARSGPRRRSPSLSRYPDPSCPRQRSPSPYQDRCPSSGSHLKPRYPSSPRRAPSPPPTNIYTPPPPPRPSPRCSPRRTNSQPQSHPHSPLPHNPVIDKSPTPYTYSDDEPDGLYIAPAKWNNFRSTATREELIIFFTFMCKTTTKEIIENVVGREFESRTRRFVVTRAGTKMLGSWAEEWGKKEQWGRGPSGGDSGSERYRERQYEDYRDSSAHGSGWFGGRSWNEEDYDFAYW